MKTYKNFILETYGSNDLVKIIRDKIIFLININFGKLLLNNSLILSKELKTIDNLIFIKDEIKINISDKNYSYIDKSDLKIDDNIIYNMQLNFDIVISSIERSMKKLDTKNKIYDDISHELLHLIELYYSNQVNKKESESWKYGEKLQILQNKYVNDKNWQEISHFIYLLLPHEIRARVQSLDTDIERKNILGIENVQNYIKTTKIYKDIEFLSNIDIDLILQDLKKDNNYYDIIKEFSIFYLENNSTNYENNFKSYIEKLQNKCPDILNKILKVSYKYGKKSTNGYILETYDREIDYSKYIDHKDRIKKLERIINENIS